jgi:flagellar biosynthesis/type III secretory pathway M-ring protein FliF/YscJ
MFSPSAPSYVLGVEAETVRSLVANDPGRTAQVIKEWIARDRSSIKRAS